ncbi:unnamed protein product [Orchesella dallaii]|uniref:Odorant receptor n=1 Tax=Orchesella dallaii TaxID=48710 RepID=A0ABP1RR55_9HEXA
MVLQGLKHFMFLGWISGAIRIKSPKGVPEAVPKKHPFSLLFLILLITNMIIRLDFYLILRNSSPKEESAVTRFLYFSMLIGESVFDIFFRSTLLLRSKLVVRFLKTLEADMKKFAEYIHLSERDRKGWKFCARLIHLSLLFHLVSGALNTNWVSKILSYSGKRGSFLLKFIPEPLYIILFFVIGELPILFSISFAFATVIVTTFHLLWIFYDFCESMEEQVLAYNGKENLALVKTHLGELDSVFSVTATAIKMQNEEDGEPRKRRLVIGEPMSVDKLVGKLEHLKLICGQFDKVCGTILLGLIVRAVYVLVSSANSILLYSNPENMAERKAKYILDLFLFIMEISQLWLLPLGYMFKTKV